MPYPYRALFQVPTRPFHLKRQVSWALKRSRYSEDRLDASLSYSDCFEKPRDGADFFPLTVDIEERMYAAGRIPGSFFVEKVAPRRRRFSPVDLSTDHCDPTSF